MENNPQLSVLIPVHNTAQFLRRCLDSICGQTYSNLEIVLVDDGSTDGSDVICNEYAERDGRVRVIKTSKCTLGEARVIGVNNSTGEILAFCDSDDWVDADYYEKLIEPLLADSEVDVAIGGYVRNYEDGREKFCFAPSPAFVMTGGEALREIICGKKMGWCIWSKVFRRRLFVGQPWLKHWPLGFSEDLWANGKALLRARKVAYVSVYGWHYYQNPVSAVRQAHNLLKIDLAAVETLHEIAQDNYGGYCPTEIVWLKMWEYGRRVLYTLRRGKMADFSAYVKYRRMICDTAILGTLSPKELQLYDALTGGDEGLAAWVAEQERGILANVAVQHSTGKQLYIYGAGRIATRAATFLTELGVDFAGYVTTRQSDKKLIGEKPVLTLGELLGKPRWAWFFLGMSKKNCDEVIPVLREHGFDWLDYNECVASLQCFY